MHQYHKCIYIFLFIIQGMFEPYLKSFYVRSTDPTMIKTLKVHMLLFFRYPQYIFTLKILLVASSICKMEICFFKNMDIHLGIFFMLSELNYYIQLLLHPNNTKFICATCTLNNPSYTGQRDKQIISALCGFQVIFQRFELSTVQNRKMGLIPQDLGKTRGKVDV